MSNVVPSLWRGTAFEWIRALAPSHRKDLGMRVAVGWLAARGFNVTRVGDSDAFQVIEGKRVDVKFSTLWANGSYRFRHIRDRGYDLVICLGVSPSDAHCWIIPKEDMIRLWKVEHRICSQHAGREGADTAWIDVRPDSPPPWLKQYGGTLSEAILLLSKITGFKVKRVEEYEA